MTKTSNFPVTLLLTRGAPASGKTTWAREWAAAASRRTRINRDDLRWNLFGRYDGLSFKEETLITTVQRAAVSAALAVGVSVVVDDTNLKARNLRGWMELAAEAGAAVEIQNFAVALDELIARDAARLNEDQRGVGASVIRGFWNRYAFLSKPADQWPVPELEPAAAKTPAVLPLAVDVSLPGWWICDLDGTIARRREEDGPAARDWFGWKRVGEDDDWPAVVKVIRALLESGERVAFFSGREDVCWEETATWLAERLSVNIATPNNDAAWVDNSFVCPLVMRKEGDSRRDSIVKDEMVDQWIRGERSIVGVFDDRGQVIDELWIPLGVRVFDVSTGVRDF